VGKIVMRRYKFTLKFVLAAGSVLSSTPPRAAAQDVLGLWFKLAAHVDTRQLERDRMRLESDMRRGDTARVNRDLALIRQDEWWLEVDRRGFPSCWGAPGWSPFVTPRAGVSVVIVNPARTGVAVSYVVDGVVYRTASGDQRTLVVAPTATIAYDRGGDFGVQRYALSAGAYEFRVSETGWALVKLRPGR
jgi:hypothetical protein